MKFEHVGEEVIALPQFFKRMLRYALLATVLLILGLVPGVIGYYLMGDMTWERAFINAISLLGGLVPPEPLETNAGHIFSAAYSLFIETIFFVAIATLVAPVIHRVLHLMHFKVDD